MYIIVGILDIIIMAIIPNTNIMGVMDITGNIMDTIIPVITATIFHSICLFLLYLALWFTFSNKADSLLKEKRITHYPRYRYPFQINS